MANASTFTASNGVVFTATNHLVQDTPAILKAKRDLVVSARNGTNPLAQKIVTAAGRIRHEYLVVWAGDQNASDHASAELSQLNPSVDPGVDDPKATEKKARDNALGPDFLAII